MLQDLSATLANVLLHGNRPDVIKNVEIVFDAPSDSFKTDGHDTINLFLYDVYENTHLRSSEPIIERQANGLVKITPPPLRFNCSYLVTAWPDTGALTSSQVMAKQQTLLGEALKIFSRTTTVKTDDLEGVLKDTIYPVSLVTAQLESTRNPWDFWAAIGGKLRSSFTVTATIAASNDDPPAEVTLVSSHNIRFSNTNYSDSSKSESAGENYQIRGRVTSAAESTPIADASITLSDADVNAPQIISRTATTDIQGRYQFSLDRPGSYKLSVQLSPTTSPSEYTINVKQKVEASDALQPFDIRI